MRSLQRVPVHYRAVLSLARSATGSGAGTLAAPAAGWCDHDAHACVTRDMHACGALLHVAGGVANAARVGSVGRVRIEIGAGESVEFDVDVRHVGAQCVGVRFLA